MVNTPARRAEDQRGRGIDSLYPQWSTRPFIRQMALVKCEVGQKDDYYGYHTVKLNSRNNL